MDEAGTEAAAATAVIMRLGSAFGGPAPFQMTFDRPFVFAVMRGDLPVFMGVVEAPAMGSY